LAGGPTRGAVRQHVAEPGGDRQHAAAEGERGQLSRTEVANNGGVDEDVERLSRQHHERRQRQRRDPPGGHPPRLAAFADYQRRSIDCCSA
jgi:hypothetical protein